MSKRTRDGKAGERLMASYRRRLEILRNSGSFNAFETKDAQADLITASKD